MSTASPADPELPTGQSDAGVLPHLGLLEMQRQHGNGNLDMIARITGAGGAQGSRYSPTLAVLGRAVAASGDRDQVIQRLLGLNAKSHAGLAALAACCGPMPAGLGAVIGISLERQIPGMCGSQRDQQPDIPDHPQEQG